MTFPRFAAAAVALAFAGLALAPGASAADLPSANATCFKANDSNNWPLTLRIVPKPTQEPPQHVEPSASDLGRCDIAAMTISVRTQGEIRNVYGQNVKLTNEDMAIETVMRWLVQAKQTQDKRNSKKTPLHILIYAHGGLVNQESAVADAEALAPHMIADGYTPIFLIWNSDLETAYIDRLCCVLDGEQTNPNPLFIPPRLFSDLGAGIARTPEMLLKQIIRWDRADVRHHDPDYFLEQFDTVRSDLSVLRQTHLTGCDKIPDSAISDPAETALGVSVIYPPFCEDGPDGVNSRRFDFNLAALSYYTVGVVTRPITTTVVGVGSSAWDNMVRRTRMAFRPSEQFVLDRDKAMAQLAHDSKPAADFCANNIRAFPTASYSQAASSAQHPRGVSDGAGGFAKFFSRLQCEINAHSGDGELFDGVTVDFYGHSMGALVGNELLAGFPDLPYRRVVYMAAATPIHDFVVPAGPVLSREPKPGEDHVKFWNLVLHPLKERRDDESLGLLPEGSLLEWIDEYFEGPRSPDGRALGKWDNFRHALYLLPPAARNNVVARVFPAQRVMPTKAFVDQPSDETAIGECYLDQTAITHDRCHPIVHGEFNQYSFWRPRYRWGDLWCSHPETYEGLAESGAKVRYSNFGCNTPTHPIAAATPIGSPDAH